MLALIGYEFLTVRIIGLSTTNMPIAVSPMGGPDRRLRNASTWKYVEQKWYHFFLHDRPWISPWIKLISNESDITCHVFASQLSGHCDVIANWLWRHQQNVKWARHSTGIWVKILVLASFVDSLCRVRNKIMYVPLWRTVYALTRVLFWCLFPSLLRNSGNKHQNNPLVSA